jgi:hypothetical protein
MPTSPRRIRLQQSLSNSTPVGTFKEKSTMYAQLMGKYSFEPEPYVASTAWKDLNWVDAVQKATRLPYAEAVKLSEEITIRQPGHNYVVERDEHGEANLPPYGLDNFVVRREE